MPTSIPDGSEEVARIVNCTAEGTVRKMLLVLREMLTAMFYDLGRDHLPIGDVNKLLTEAVPFVKFTDKHLEAWAREKANIMLEVARHHAVFDPAPKPGSLRVFDWEKDGEDDPD